MTLVIRAQIALSLVILFITGQLTLLSGLIHEYVMLV